MNKEKAKAIGIDKFLVKPVKIDALAHAIREVLIHD